MAKSLCVITILWCLIGSVCQAADNRFLALCYHNVKDRLTAEDEGTLTINTGNLINQFAWLQEHNYHVISIQDVLDAQAGRHQLPDKAVLLTFDDGYVSFYKRVFPLLKLFQYPAVLGLVGRWLDAPMDAQIQYGDRKQLPRKAFLSWQQINEIQKSGLVEIASHSYDLHHGITGNPEGNLQPAATTRRYDPDTRTYESSKHFTQRIRTDLKRNSDLLYEKTGIRPRVMVWPYGAYSQEVLKIAKANGMHVTFTLSDGFNQPADLAQVRRQLIQDNLFLSDFIYSLSHPETIDPVRVAHIDLDYIHDPDPKQTEKNLGKLLDRVKAMHINTVFLQAFADPDGDGNANAVYFPNRHLPMTADLFNRVAWQLKTQGKVRVFAWMPVLSFQLPNMSQHQVQEWYDNRANPSRNHYQRLSWFDPTVKRVIGEIYQDLALHSHFDGLLFHDDAFLSDFEDVSPVAMRYAEKNWALPQDYRKIRENPDYFANWTAAKTRSLIDFTHQLAQQVRYYRPEIKTARNIYAELILNPESQTWFAQSFPEFLRHYDYTAVMAMPYMEKAQNPQRWLEALINRVGHYPDAFDKTVFELQAVDWHTRQPISADILAAQMKLLDQKGAIQFGYYPDNVYENHPPLETLKRALSLNVFPYGS